MRSHAAPCSARALCLAALLLVAFGSRAHAQSRLVVLPFEGAHGARVRAALVRALSTSRNLELVSTERVEGAADALDADLDRTEGRAAVAQELSIDSFVMGRVRKRGRNFVLMLSVYGGPRFDAPQKLTVRSRRVPALAAAAHRRLLTQLPRPARDEPDRALQSDSELPDSQLEAKADRELEPERAPEAEPTRSAEPEPEPEAPSRPTALELSARLRFVSRDYDYEDLQTSLPRHSWNPTPAARLSLRWYPAAHFTGGLAAHVGLDLYAQLLLPIEAHQHALVFTTESRALGAALRVRIPIAASELGVHAGFGTHDVSISNSQFGGDPDVPSVAYRFVRVGADARIALAQSWQIDASASYLLLTAFGELADARWFPHTSGGGFEAELGVSYAIAKPLWLDAKLGLLRYFMSFNPEPDDVSVIVARRVAGGATDQQLSASVGATVRW